MANKTALQSLIDHSQATISGFVISLQESGISVRERQYYNSCIGVLEATIIKAAELLEVEKKQIITAFFDGATHIINGGEFGFEGNENTAKTYYETTYQNTSK